MNDDPAIRFLDLDDYGRDRATLEDIQIHEIRLPPSDASISPITEVTAKAALLRSLSEHLETDVPNWDALADALWDVASGDHCFVVHGAEELMRNAPRCVGTLIEVFLLGAGDDDATLRLWFVW